eukprot:gene6482-26624_t
MTVLTMVLLGTAAAAPPPPVLHIAINGSDTIAGSLLYTHGFVAAAAAAATLALVKQKLEALISGGAASLAVTADWDRTITKGSSVSSHGALETCDALDATYRATATANTSYYLPIEQDPSLTIAQKLPHMRDWYAKNHVAICDAGIRKSDVGMAVKSSLADGKLLVRDGAVDMLARAHAAKVPLLIFSAGLADVIEEVLTQVGAPVGSSTSIVSNRMRWKHAPASEPARRHPSSGDNEDESDDGSCDARTTPLPGGASSLTPAPSATQLLHSFSEPLIHMFNKNQSQVPVADQHGRPHALVLGDGLGDPAMLDGAARPPTHILRIGFLNYADPENHIAKYEKVYDIVLLGDQTMAPVNAVFEAVCA